MPVYVISEVVINDEAIADKYRALTPGTITKYGGHYVVRGATIEVVEGEWPPNQAVVIVEFPTVEQAHEWYDSPEYGECRALARQALTRRILFVDFPTLAKDAVDTSD